MTAIINPALAAAADFDLYRVCADIGQPAQFRTRNGIPIALTAVYHAIAGGLLGQFAKYEALPDGVFAERLDLSEAGLDYAARRLND